MLFLHGIGEMQRLYCITAPLNEHEEQSAHVKQFSNGASQTPLPQVLLQSSGQLNSVSAWYWGSGTFAHTPSPQYGLQSLGQFEALSIG